MERTMTTAMKDYSASFLTKQDPASVYRAITNFRAWWSQQIEGNTDTLNETFFYHYKDVHMCKIRLIEAVPNKRLVYHILDNHFSFIEDKTEWINTKLVFEISSAGAETKVTFTHEGLNATHECYEVCNDSWGNYINKSLYNLITSGEGAPNPLEGEGFNASIVEKWKLNSGKIHSPKAV